MSERTRQGEGRLSGKTIITANKQRYLTVNLAFVKIS